jgi:hypothetical protein
MNTWLTQSFQEFTVVWLLISTTVGGVIGACITLVFDDILRPRLAMRREVNKTYRKYKNPLLGTANSLERQINTMVRSSGDPALKDDYYKLSTFYKFGSFLFWVRQIEQDTGFLDLNSSRKAKQFTKTLYAPFAGLSSVRHYFKGQPFAEESALPRDIARAIGEEMLDAEQKYIDRPSPLGFAGFVRRYATDLQFRIWFVSLDNMLNDLAHDPKLIQLERLVITAAHLKRLMTLLDSGSTFVDTAISNLEKIERKELVEQLRKEGIHKGDD